MTAGTPSLEELFLLVADLGASTAFYRDGLGLRAEYEGHNFVVLRGEGGPRLLLHEAEGEPVEPGSFQLEIRVDDVEQRFPGLVTRGGRLHRAPFRVSHEGDPWSPRREVRLKDPDGYGVVLFSPAPSE